MKFFVLIAMTYLGLTACRSSYDEAQGKAEIQANTSTQVGTPIVESPSTSTGSGTTTSGSSNSSSSNSTPVATDDPNTIATQHNASSDELKKYNCKGSALITDSGMDDNKDGVLQDSEIQETRIDCTEAVPANH